MKRIARILLKSIFMLSLSMTISLSSFSQISLSSAVIEISWHYSIHNNIPKVKNIRVREYNLLDKNDTLGKLATDFLFDSKGNKTNIISYINKGKNDTYLYDTSGHLISMNRTLGKDTPVTCLIVKNIKYNKEGKIKTFEEKYPNQNLYSIIKTSYDETGFPAKIVTTLFYESSIRQETSSALGSQKFLYKYYTDKEPHIKKNPDKMVVMNLCKLDRNKRIIKITTIGEKINFTQNYFYDDKGLLVELVKDDALNHVRERCVFTYTYY